MPNKKNRIRRSCLLGGIVTLMLMLVILPSTLARYTSQDWGTGEIIQTAEFDVASVKVEYDSYVASGDADEAYEIAPYEYDLTTVTLTAGGTATSGYFIVTYDDETYYSECLEPDETAEFTLFGRYDEDDFAVKPSWGSPPEDEKTLADLSWICRDEISENAGKYFAEQQKLLEEQQNAENLEQQTPQQPETPTETETETVPETETPAETETETEPETPAETETETVPETETPAETETETAPETPAEPETPTTDTPAEE